MKSTASEDKDAGDARSGDAVASGTVCWLGTCCCEVPSASSTRTTTAERSRQGIGCLNIRCFFLTLTWDCGDHFSNLQPVEYRGLARTIQSEDEDPHLLLAP